MGSGASAAVAAACANSSDADLAAVVSGLPAEARAKLKAALDSQNVLRLDSLGIFEFAVEAPADKVAAFLAMPLSWVKLMGMPEDTAINSIKMPNEGDFRVQQGDSFIWMLETKVADGEGAGVKNIFLPCGVDFHVG